MEGAAKNLTNEANLKNRDGQFEGVGFTVVILGIGVMAGDGDRRGVDDGEGIRCKRRVFGPREGIGREREAGAREPWRRGEFGFGRGLGTGVGVGVGVGVGARVGVGVGVGAGVGVEQERGVGGRVAKNLTSEANLRKGDEHALSCTVLMTGIRLI